MDDVEFQGLLDADLRRRPWTVAFESSLENVNIGRLLDKLAQTPAINAHADKVQLRIQSEGSSLQQLIANGHLNAEVSALLWAFHVGPEDDDGEVHLSTLTFQAAPGSALTGEAQGTLNGVAMSVYVQTPTLRRLTEPGSSLPFTLALQSQDDLLMVDALLLRESDGQHSGRAVISGGNADKANIDLSTLVSPLSDFEIDSSFIIDEDQVVLPDLSVRIDSSSVTGKVDIRYLDPVYRITADLHSPFLQTDDLVSFAEDWRESHRLLRASDENPAGSAEPGRGFMTLFSQAIDDILDSNHFDIHVSVNELRAGSSLLGETLLVTRSDSEDFRIDPLKITTPEGIVEAKYVGRRVASGYELSLDVHIPDLEYGDLLRLLDPDSEARGRLYLDTSLRSESPDPATIVQHVSGSLDMMVVPENVPPTFWTCGPPTWSLPCCPARGPARK